MKFEHLSIDIETLGTKPGSIILSVGLIPFTLREPVKGENADYWRISVIDSLICGLVADEDTLEWWSKQTTLARKALEIGEMRTLQSTWYRLEHVLKTHCTDKCHVWMKGTSFDGVLLGVALEKVGAGVPWKYWQERDVRTICDGIIEPERIGTHHNSADDAVHQAKWVRDALMSREVLTDATHGEIGKASD